MYTDLSRPNPLTSTLEEVRSYLEERVQDVRSQLSTLSEKEEATKVIDLYKDLLHGVIEEF